MFFIVYQLAYKDLKLLVFNVGLSFFFPVVKPYEPPGLGKPSRVTPVGLDEADLPDHLSLGAADSLHGGVGGPGSVDTESNVEVVSVIRFNKGASGSLGKSGMHPVGGAGSCSTATHSGATSEKRSSSSDTTSLFNSSNCPACDAAAAAAAASRRVRSRSATRPPAEPSPSGDKFDLTSLGAASEATTVTATASTATGSLPSIVRRSSAPEIDEKSDPAGGGVTNPDALSRISEVTSVTVTTASGEATMSSAYSRSLDRPRHHHHHHNPPSDSSVCSDSETASARASVASLDKRDLQRAVAHLQEALQERMGRKDQHQIAQILQGQSSEVKAVVHRGAEPVGVSGSAGSASSKTLDSQTIKHHESIKQNQYHLGPYDTIKPSRIKRHSSGDSLATTATTTSASTVTSMAKESKMSTASGVSSVGGGSSILKKRDSFEGHEDAVRTLVEAVQESRKFGDAGGKKSKASGAASSGASEG